MRAGSMAAGRREERCEKRRLTEADVARVHESAVRVCNREELHAWFMCDVRVANVLLYHVHCVVFIPLPEILLTCFISSTYISPTIEC